MVPTITIEPVKISVGFLAGAECRGRWPVVRAFSAHTQITPFTAAELSVHSRTVTWRHTPPDAERQPVGSEAHGLSGVCERRATRYRDQLSHRCHTPPSWPIPRRSMWFEPGRATAAGEAFMMPPSAFTLLQPVVEE